MVAEGGFAGAVAALEAEPAQLAGLVRVHGSAVTLDLETAAGPGRLACLWGDWVVLGPSGALMLHDESPDLDRGLAGLAGGLPAPLTAARLAEDHLILGTDAWSFVTFTQAATFRFMTGLDGPDDPRLAEERPLDVAPLLWAAPGGGEPLDHRFARLIDVSHEPWGGEYLRAKDAAGRALPRAAWDAPEAGAA